MWGRTWRGQIETGSGWSHTYRVWQWHKICSLVLMVEMGSFERYIFSFASRSSFSFAKLKKNRLHNGRWSMHWLPRKDLKHFNCLSNQFPASMNLTQTLVLNGFPYNNSNVIICNTIKDFAYANRWIPPATNREKQNEKKIRNELTTPGNRQRIKRTTEFIT